MPRKQVLSLRCPSCRKLVLRDDQEFPFCSERCRLIDLGKWASGGYVISSPITDPEDIETLQKAREAEQAHPKNKNNDDRNFH
jgi:endogenous inhibitor of DNA gyrase (YacG/DUF329 family)